MEFEEDWLKGLMGGMLVLGLSLSAGPVMATEAAGMEKCYGIAKKGMNDCGTERSSCEATSTQDNDKQAWIFVPTGTCQKIVGGSTKAGG